MADRAGHWKHEWVPLDPPAAKEKFHGHVPESWHAPGGGFPDHAQHARDLAAEIRSRQRSVTLPGGATDQVLQKSNEYLGAAAGHLDQAAEHLGKGNAEEGRRSVSKARKSLYMYHRNRNETRLSQMGLAAKADRLHSDVMAAALHGKTAARHDAYVDRTRAICRAIGLRL